MRIAVLDRDKCSPIKCGDKLCKRVCPINRGGEECIVDANDGKVYINEGMCIGCNICVRRCPFGAISIVNLSEELLSRLVYRYGQNGFTLYSLPTPRFGKVLGFLGKNGIGKSTALEILGKKLSPNLGIENPTEHDVMNFFKGSELFNYFEKLQKLKIAIKPQNLSQLVRYKIKVIDFLLQFAKKSEINSAAKGISIDYALDKNLNELSGGELQKISILAATLKDADIYFFDEPLAFLDICERIKVSDYIRNLSKKNKAVVLIEHDLLLLDYMTDYVNIIYGKPGCYGIIAEIRAAKKAINDYLSGFLKEENIRFRDKPIKFDFSSRIREKAYSLFEWPAFTKSYNNFKLKVDAGSINSKSIVGIAGRNAIGKTTFVKCIAGLLETDDKNLKLKMKISYKPQYLEENDTQSVTSVVKKEKINKRLISLLSLEQLMMRQLKQLSGGELQRLAIAACLAKEADVYLLDEPSAYLDVEERLQAARAIEETIREKESAAFVVDHDLLFLSYLADSLIIFSGQSAVSGKASSTYDIMSGMNGLLKMLGITLRKDEETGRPRINKPDSVLDREQRKKGNFFQT